MKLRRPLSIMLGLSISAVIVLAGCQPRPRPRSSYLQRSDRHPLRRDRGASPSVYKDPTASVEQRVEDLLGRMTLAEKIGQMTQVEKNSIKKDDIAGKFIGSLLSGGGGAPDPNTAENWLAKVNDFQGDALKTRLGIPLIYGVDAVHGHNNLRGATIFPHNIGLGAAGDADLVRQIGRATAEEMAATGIPWNFAPTVAVPQDIRWGRTYEGYAENTGSLRGWLQPTWTACKMARPRSSALPSTTLVMAARRGAVPRGNLACYMLDQGDDASTKRCSGNCTCRPIGRG